MPLVKVGRAKRAGAISVRRGSSMEWVPVSYKQYEYR